jgi:hypothetical protein
MVCPSLPQALQQTLVIRGFEVKEEEEDKFLNPSSVGLEGLFLSES